MRLLSLGILSLLLAAVYWVGATVYSERIEQDIAERSSIALAEYPQDLDISVDGRDVTIIGEADSDQQREEIRTAASTVWGVRKTADSLDIKPAAIPFDFNADYENQRLHMSGTVDTDEALDLINNISNALPPNTLISTGVIGTGAALLTRSPEKVETGIAALTQLNRGDLEISDEDFILNGIVSDEERRNAIERLIATRKAVLEPLNVKLNIEIDPYIGVTQACRDAMTMAMKNNVLNYKVDFSNIEPYYEEHLDRIAAVVNGVCEGQVTKILIESHADVTGGEGYNQGLSERRADTAHRYLADRGVATNKLAAFGYGEFRPIASNETVEGRALNRRTEIHLSIEKLTVSTNSEE